MAVKLVCGTLLVWQYDTHAKHPAVAVAAVHTRVAVVGSPKLFLFEVDVAHSFGCCDVHKQE